MPTGSRGTGAAAVVRRVVNNTVEATADQRAAVAADPRAGAAEFAAARLAVGSPPVRTRCSCPTAASARAALAASAVAGSLGAAVDCGAVAVAVLGDGRVVASAVAVAVPDVVALWKLLPNLPLLVRYLVSPAESSPLSSFPLLWR